MRSPAATGNMFEPMEVCIAGHGSGIGRDLRRKQRMALRRLKTQHSGDLPDNFTTFFNSFADQSGDFRFALYAAETAA